MRLPPALVGGIMTAVKEGRDLASGKLPPGVDGAALMHTVKGASAAGFTSGMHAALWVSGFMLLAGAPIALLTIRGTAPHHVAARQAAAHKAQVAAREGGSAAEAVEVES